MIYSQAIAPRDQFLSNEQIIETLEAGIGNTFRNQHVLVLIPDHTCSLPLPFLFRTLVGILRDAKQLDFMVALGTHPPLSETRLNKLVGITSEERTTTFNHVRLLNHAWNEASALTSLGTLEQNELNKSQVHSGMSHCRIKLIFVSAKPRLNVIMF